MAKKKEEITIRSSTAEYLTYIASVGDVETSFEMRYEDENIWLTQKLMAALYDVDVRTVNYHIKKIFADSELQEDSVIRKFRITADDGKTYNTNHYSLEMIIAVGFKVNSERAVQFRKWVNQIAKDYTIKGWVMDVERIKRGTYLTEKYFDEQLERIREIRASERKFYQKVTDLYATAIDYDRTAAATKRFYATVQNKMHFAIHGHTAAELIVERADHRKEHMGLTTWADAPDGKIKRSDVTIAKNYLSEFEIGQLDRMVSAYLDFAESMTLRHIPLTLVHDIDEHGKWTRLSEGCILRAPVPAAMTPSVDLVTQQYQTSTYDVQIYKITTKSGPLHLRSGTGTNYKILGKYKKGREVIVLNKTTSSWYEVTAPDGKHGYMASQYLTFQRTETQFVQTNVGFRNQVIEARQLRDQPFRIYRVVPELDKITVYARHIFYDLLDNMIKSLKPSPSAVGASVVQTLSGACLSPHDFSFYSDLTSTAEDVEWENVNPVEAMLGENGLVSKYGAELARDWYDVFLVKRVGNDTDVSIREKKNLTGISYDVDESDVVTRIMPTGEDAETSIPAAHTPRCS